MSVMAHSYRGAVSAPAQDPFAPLAERLEAIGQQAKYNAQVAVAEALQVPAGYVYQTSAPWMGVCIMFVMAATLAGFRLSKVSKPEAQLLSPMLRTVGWVAGWGGLSILLSGLLLAAILAGGFWFLGHQGLLTGLYGQHIKMAVVSLVLGTVLGLHWTLWVIPRWERGSGLSDVEELVRDFKRFNTYDPARFFIRRKGCFVGLGADGKPIYIPWKKLRSTHIQVQGGTGAGKGVLMLVVATQAVRSGEATIWIDAKGDQFAPRVLKKAADNAGRPFVFINLNADQPPQFSLFASAHEFDILDLLVTGFDLRAKGSDSDYHRSKDEDAAMEAARLVVAHDIKSISALIAACSGAEEMTENLLRHLRKLGRLDVIDTDGGVDLVQAIEQRAVVYIRGSADSEVVKTLQKMVVMRIMQIIKSRPETDYDQPVCLVLDELKHLLSPPVTTGLGVIRSFGAHCILAHQSAGDLEAFANIPPAEARGAVVDNTILKFIYRVTDGGQAEAIAKAAGSRRTFAEATTKGVDEDGAHGAWREQHVPYLSPDLLTHLPLPTDRPRQASTGVLIGWGNARLFYVGPLKATGPMPSPIEAPKAGPADGAEGPI
jgi:hypothetical protein